METQARPSSDTATNTWTKDLTCWHMATSPQCLRVETTSEIHLFAYGYFQHARFFRQGSNDIVEIHFQGQIIIAKGKGLEPVCDALARLGLERMRLRPEKYDAGTKEGMIVEIEIRHLQKEANNPTIS